MNTLHSTVKTYKDVSIFNSKVGVNSSIGDYSKVINSTLSDSVRIDRNNYIKDCELGRFTYTGKNSTLININAGAFCSISWNVSIGAANHDYKKMAQHSFLYNEQYNLIPKDQANIYDRFREHLIIGNDVWVAAGVVITRGVIIGDGAVIGANSVVTKDIPPYAIAVGAPARVIKYRFSPEIISLMLQTKWWNWPISKIKKHYKVLSEEPSIDTLTNLLRKEDDSI
jgi:acetyltransferase-like isoleucine patch superfamily enzyme